MASSRETYTVMPLDGSESGSSLGAWSVGELDPAHGTGGFAQATYAIEQGPPGLRLLAQWAAVTSCVNSTMVCAGVPQFRGMLTSLVATCQAAFAVTAWMFEVELACVKLLPFLNAFQDLLLDKTPFLADVGARGLFYFLQGFLWLPFASFEEPHHLVAGIWLGVVGIFHVCVYLDWMPRRILAKARRQPVFSRECCEAVRPLEEEPAPVAVTKPKKVLPGAIASCISLEPAATSQPKASPRSPRLDGARQEELRDPADVDPVETAPKAKSPKEAGTPPKMDSPREASPPKVPPKIQQKPQQSCCELM